MYARRLQDLVKELLTEFRIVYLTGPRQAGKTTLARAVAERTQMHYVTLDDQATLASVRSDPQGFVRSLGARKVVIDEFQYAPELISAVKEASDNLGPEEKGKFLLTGSTDIFRSARIQEALPGHMARLELYPLSVSELTEKKSNFIDHLLVGNLATRAPNVTREQLASWILQGGYPEVQSKSRRARQIWYKSYMEGRLYKDFETLYAARGDYHSRLQAMAPFLAGLTGNLLKYANVATDLGLNDKLVKTYIEILDLMFIVRRAPAYLKNRAKQLATQMPKLHFIDTGLACHLLGLHNEEQILSSQYYGGLLETLIFMECCKQSSWALEEVGLYHFRDNRKHEVDIVLERSNGGITGIEVKASATVKIQDFRGLAALAASAGRHFEQGILFYTGQQMLPFRYQDFTFHAVPIGFITGEPG
jgi:predicted AAA+ superfamily ATPase